MKLKEILDIIVNSTSENWNGIGCWGYGSGPSYKNQFTFYEIFNGEPNILTAESHSDILVYKDDLSITMAYGLISNNDFKEEWANQFPDPKAHSAFIDIFYNNSLVFRETYLVVDGGRCRLPIPNFGENGDLIVPQQYYDFIKILEMITSGSSKNYESYFKRTGTKIIDAEWN